MANTSSTSTGTDVTPRSSLDLFASSGDINEQDNTSKKPECISHILDGSYNNIPQNAGTCSHYPVGKCCRLIANDTNYLSPNGYSMCKWSPDGKILLASGLSVFTHLYLFPTMLESAVPRNILQLNSPTVVHHGEALWDACWHPTVAGHFATCCQDHPVQVWDANSGQVAASYSTYHKHYKVHVASYWF